MKKNLIVNGDFTNYTLNPNQWGTSNHLKAAGRHNGDQFVGLGGWKCGVYKDKAQQVSVQQPQDAVDLINGEADGQFPKADGDTFFPSENFIDINGNATLGFIEQEVEVDPESLYELTFYYGYNMWPGHDIGRPTYLRVEVETTGRLILQRDFIKYYTGKKGVASQSKQPTNDPAWQKGQLFFYSPKDVEKVTVRFVNPGRAGIHKELNANSDGHSGMTLAHIALSPASATKPRLSLAPSNSLVVHPGDKWKYPAFRITNTTACPVEVAEILFHVPSGMRFMEDWLPYTRQDDAGQEDKASCERANEGRTLYCRELNLKLAPGKWAVVRPAVEIATTADPGQYPVEASFGPPFLTEKVYNRVEVKRKTRPIGSGEDADSTPEEDADNSPG
ncbi:hypothetical protein [Streptomyces sp. NPDC093707]|uniref:hypothetical protein n=1 Tax=Streptomyces sp. NPDC093707 TaxID=3154984 RepID=UPI00344D4851